VGKVVAFLLFAMLRENRPLGDQVHLLRNLTHHFSATGANWCSWSHCGAPVDAMPDDDQLTTSSSQRADPLASPSWISREPRVDEACHMASETNLS